MEFDKSRVYTSVNADELRAGDKVIVANSIGTLKRNVANNVKPLILLEVIDEDYDLRFEVNFNKGRYALAYLVERKENCTNCGGRITCARQKPEHPELTKCCNYKHYECSDYKQKTEQKAEKKYRPFRDTDELIKGWDAKFYLNFKPSHDPLTMPHIWVKYKGDDTDRGRLIISFSNNGYSVIDVDEIEVMLWEDLFEKYTFLDGSPCGVEE